MYKLIALDVDGTLLDSSHQLPEKNKVIIKKLVKDGIHIVLSTGKSFCTIQNLLIELNLTSPQITSDGASIVDPITGNPIHRVGLGKDITIELLNLLERLGATAIVVSENTSYTKEINVDILYMKTYGDPEPTLVENMTDVLQFEPTHIMVVAYNKDDLYESVFQTLKNTFGEKINVFKSSPYFIEVLNPLASKGNALRDVLNYLGIDPQNAVCIGDGLNDLTMFENVGLSIAMGNSPAELKKAASFVTETNDNWGVAIALERLFEKNKS